jgi:hypothetical protein
VTREATAVVLAQCANETTNLRNVLHIDMVVLYQQKKSQRPTQPVVLPCPAPLPPPRRRDVLSAPFNTQQTLSIHYVGLLGFCPALPPRAAGR